MKLQMRKLTITIKRLFQEELNLDRKFVCTDKSNDRNKTKLPPPPSTQVTVFLIAEKQLSLRL